MLNIYVTRDKSQSFLLLDNISFDQIEQIWQINKIIYFIDKKV